MDMDVYWSRGSTQSQRCRKNGHGREEAERETVTKSEGTEKTTENKSIKLETTGEAKFYIKEMEPHKKTDPATAKKLLYADKEGK